jgi:hypothetical protein
MSGRGDTPGYETAREAEELGRALAFTEEEATAFLRQGGDETACAVTGETALATLRQCLGVCENWWT